MLAIQIFPYSFPSSIKLFFQVNEDKPLTKTLTRLQPSSLWFTANNFPLEPCICDIPQSLTVHSTKEWKMEMCLSSKRVSGAFCLALAWAGKYFVASTQSLSRFERRDIAKLRGIVGKTSTKKSFWVELCQSLMAIKLSVWRNISTNYEWNFPAQSPADAKTVTRPNNLSNWSNIETFSVGINICCWCSEIK